MKFTKAIVKKVTNEMREMCGDYGFNGVYNISAAATRVSGCNDPNSVRGSQAALVSVNKRTVERWYIHWLDFGCYFYDKVPELKVSKNSKWTRKIVDALKKHLTDYPILYLDEMSAFLKNKFKMVFSVSNISSKLDEEGWTRKVVYAKATQAIARHQRHFTASLHYYITSPKMAIFLDESNKDRKAARRKYGWCPRGERVSYRQEFDREVRYTMLGAADCHGFIVHACDVVLHKCAEKEECPPVDAERFVQWFKTKVAPILGRHDRREDHSVLVLDNCSIHLDPRVLEMVEKAGAKIIFSSPYSPELNPIEFMFSEWKSFLKRNHIDFTKNWYNTHLAAINSITPVHGLNFFKKTTLVHLVEDDPLLQSEEQKDTEECLAILAGIGMMVGCVIASN